MKPGTNENAVVPSGGAHRYRVPPPHTIQELPGRDSEARSADDPDRANASGKSNIRDAFLLLHGIGRGYTLAEIFGENYVGGGRVWSGTRAERVKSRTRVRLVRAGCRDAAASGKREPPLVAYRIEVSVAGTAATAPRVVHESLQFPLVFGKNVKARARPGFGWSGPEGPKG